MVVSIKKLLSLLPVLIQEMQQSSYYTLNHALSLAEQFIVQSKKHLSDGMVFLAGERIELQDCALCNDFSKPLCHLGTSPSQLIGSLYPMIDAGNFATTSWLLLIFFPKQVSSIPLWSHFFKGDGILPASSEALPKQMFCPASLPGVELLGLTEK